MTNLLSLPCLCDSSLKSLWASQTHFLEELDCNSFVRFQLIFVGVEIQRCVWISVWIHFSTEFL